MIQLSCACQFIENLKIGGKNMSYMENYLLWLNSDKLTEADKYELSKLDEKEKEDAFYKNLSFGTGGLRGIMGLGTNRVNIFTIRKATLGLANYLLKNNLLDGVAISYDNRKDSKTFAFESAKVLASKGIKSYIFKELKPTPMLSFAVRYFSASAGIMITASHNPKEYNGYKVYNSTGAQINLDEANTVIKEIEAINNMFDIEGIESNHIHWIEEDLEKEYIKRVQAISLQETKKTVKIVYSPLHGTGQKIIPKILKNQNYLIYPYMPQMVEDPNFSATKSSNPEDKLAYEGALSYAKEIDADIVMVTDPDADRLGIAVKHQGEYHLINGNQTGAIELYYILSTLSKQNKLPKKGYVFSTVVTTNLIDVITKHYNQAIIHTLTGFKFIGEQAEKLRKDEVYLFGCEESYGSLVRDFVRDKDAVQAVYLLAEIADYLKDNNQTMVDYLEEIYQKFGYFFEETTNITLKGVEGLNKIYKIMSYFKENHLKIDGYNLTSVSDFSKSIRYEDGKEHTILLPQSEVVKFVYNHDSWIVLRPSGTEPKLKIYYSAKQDSLEKAKSVVQRFDKICLEIIDQLIK